MRSVERRDRERRFDLAQRAGFPLRILMLLARHNRLPTDAAILRYNPRVYISGWYERTRR